jgi:colicin import membrane protein
MILSEDSAEKPKKKRGRPKTSKNKTETKKPKIKATEKKEPTTVSISNAEKATALAEKAAALAEDAKLKAEAEAEAEYQVAVKLVATSAEDAGEVLPNRRNQERIFRREMGEPEFFRSKKELTPLRSILSETEELEISRKVQIPIDNIPKYEPEHILSPEYAGLSTYELGISTVREETEEKLAALRNDPNANYRSIEKAEEDLQLIENLVNNFSISTSVFRTAKGGRDKLKK